ncbi:MAG TPA: hypothetical protein VFH11_06115, partial [Gemmatimonadota bacterium]|nr:hypothetical protein [Gemmatimonadota bacterium]
FALSLAPPLAAGAALTLLFLRAGLLDSLPGLWLLLYGTGVVTGGAFSERIVPLTGLAFMLAGVAALALPEPGPEAWMAIGFGGIHIAFGSLLIWRHWWLAGHPPMGAPRRGPRIGARDAGSSMP